MVQFIDYVEVKLTAGKGGDGLVSFRRERFVDRGGPDGGDGGDGGDIILQASRSVNTLRNFRHRHEIKAEDGQPGGRSKRRGKSGEDLIIEVPVGTVVKSGGKTIADLKTEGEKAIVAHGGKGGFGNAHFVSSTRQAPRLGESLTAVLELKLLAEVGLVGLPNAGKSTLLSVISNAQPEIDSYPFTTIVPNLGVVDIDGHSVLFADIPGLIAGASQGKGLGDQFLRHVERTKVLIHLIDAYVDDHATAYLTVMEELEQYSPDLVKKPQIVALSKIDSLPEARVRQALKSLARAGAKDAIAVSAKTGQNLETLLRATWSKLNASHTEKSQRSHPLSGKAKIKRVAFTGKPEWEVVKTKRGWKLKGRKINNFALKTDFASDDGVKRLLDIMARTGIIRELINQGAKSGDNIRFSEAHKSLRLP